jgi:hypothetical protein
LAALDRHTEAARTATEAIKVLAPFVERYSQTYQGLARTIGADIRRYCEAAGQQPDTALLARVARALSNGEAVKEDSAIVALKARAGAILEAAEKSGTLDEVALAELPAELADQLRTVWASRAD